MDFFRKKTPFEREMMSLLKKEAAFLKERESKKESFLNQKLEEKVPKKLQETLNTAFFKAFSLIFEKGTGVIEKTYQKEALEKSYQVNQYADELNQTKKTLQAFSKQAKLSRNKNLLASCVSGVGMGVLGVGLPDIPVFTGMMFKSIYQIALSYGYSYESEEEQYFILLLIQGAVTYAENLLTINEAVDRYIQTNELPEGYKKEKLMKQTSEALSKELLYMKFLQGIPVVGAIGGAYDAIYIKKITEYAGLKYKRRFLLDKTK